MTHQHLLFQICSEKSSETQKTSYRCRWETSKEEKTEGCGESPEEAEITGNRETAERRQTIRASQEAEIQKV